MCTPHANSVDLDLPELHTGSSGRANTFSIQEDYIRKKGKRVEDPRGGGRANKGRKGAAKGFAKGIEG